MSTSPDEQSAWRPLPGTHEGVPSLLVSASFTQTSYTIRITDLANIWMESLDQQAIEKRSAEEKSSIDPSQDTTQLQILLGKIEAAFDQTLQDHDDISLNLSCNSSHGGAKDPKLSGLLLRVTCILPRPLAPLKWPIHLTMCPQSFVTSQLVFPLICSQQTAVQQTKKLISLIRQKDNVITKLVDKLEATGTSLDTVFTSLSSKRKVTRAVAEEKIPGLTLFNETEFREKFKNTNLSRDGNQNPGDLIQDTFGGIGFRYDSNFDEDQLSSLNDWWMKLKRAKGDLGVHLVERQQPAKSDRASSTQFDNSGAENDEFQVQSTPPHLMSARKKNSAGRPQPDLDEESTESEDGSSHIPDSNPLLQPSSTQNLSDSKSRLGTIGKVNVSEPLSKSPSPTQAKVTGKQTGDKSMKFGDDNDTTASEGSDNESTSSSASPPQRMTIAASRGRQSGLGRIGGLPKSKLDNSSSPHPPPSPIEHPITSDTESSLPKPAHRRLGVIGRKASPITEPAIHTKRKSAEPRGRSRSPAIENDDKDERRQRETSGERANRKRIELQKELEKAAAAPAKKKRKF